MNIFESMNYGFDKKYKLRESKEDKERFLNFTGQDLYNRFETLKSKQIIKGQDADYTYWEKQPLENLVDFISRVEKEHEEKKAKEQAVSKAYKKRDEMEANLQEGEDYKIIYNKNGWKVYHILTYEASAVKGKGSKWCISGLYPGREGPEEGKYWFDYYLHKGVKDYYFLIPDENPETGKYAYTYFGYELTKNDDWFWDADDREGLTIEEVAIPYDVLFSLPGVSQSLVDITHDKREVATEVRRTGCYTYNPLDNNDFIRKLNPKKVVIPDGVTEIGEAAFCGCTSLQKIILPYSLKEIGERAFYGCKSLKEINIPDKVAEIKRETFYKCQSLKEITFPNGLKEIGDFAFDFCVSLEKIVVPSGVTIIGIGAFGNCSSLQSLVISSSVVYIGYSVVANDCKALKEIQVKGQYKPEIFNNALSLFPTPEEKNCIVNWVDCGIKDLLGQLS